MKRNNILCFLYNVFGKRNQEKISNVDQRPRTITKIENLKVEIDYDELADAIVKAEKSTNEVKGYTSNTFAALAGFIFRMAGGIGLLMSVFGTIYGIVYLVNFDWKNASILGSVMLIIFVAMIFVFIFAISILLLKSAKEIEYEKDRQFVVSVFSAIVSFTALIVALVALNK